LVGCGSRERPKVRDVLSYADPIVDTLLAGLDEGKYQKFSRYFDAQMRRALNSNSFMQLRQQIINRVGRYQSRQFDRIGTKGEFIAVIYKCQFENDLVTIRVVFRQEDPNHRVTGLWFTSPRLNR